MARETRIGGERVRDPGSVDLDREDIRLAHGTRSTEQGAQDLVPAIVNSRPLFAADVSDPEVAAELARTAVANRLAIFLIEYRVRHGLTQTALARQLGVRQPAVARLEAGDHDPSLAMLARLARQLGVTIRLDLTPDAVQLTMGTSPEELVASVLADRAVDRSLG